MVIIRFLTFFFLMIISQVNASNPPMAFDSIYCKTLHAFSDAEPTVVLESAKQLINNAKTNKEQMDGILSKASLLMHYGAVDEAIIALKGGEKLCHEAKLYEHGVYVQLMLSRLYRENGIDAMAIRALEHAKEMAKQVNTPEERLFINGSISLEETRFLMMQEKYREAIDLLRESRVDSKGIKHIKFNRHLYALMDRLMAANYIALGLSDEALKYLKQALIEIEQAAFPQEYLKGFVYKDIADAYLEKKDSLKAEDYLMQAFQIGQTTKHFVLQKSVYVGLLNLYKRKQDSEEYMFYTEKFFSLLNEEKTTSRKVVNQVAEEYTRIKDQVPGKKHTYMPYALVCVGLLSIVQGSTLYRRRNKKVNNVNENTKVRLPLLDIEQAKDNHQFDHKSEIMHTEDQEKSYLPQETERTILDSLAQFESEKLFLSKDISLTFLSAKMGTNHRYLSYVINKHRQKDFTSYINELRINYILDLLQKKPESLKYKISYLAEVGGFASHSRFTVIFKRIVGVSPSDYIQELKDREEGK